MSVNELGRRLKKARLDSGYTQAEVAEKMGCTYQAISGYERGVVRVGSDALFRLCEIYGISLGDLMRTPAWDGEMFRAYNSAEGSAEKMRYFRDWGVPSELLEEYNGLREPDLAPLSPEDEALLYAYHHADEHDRALIDIIIRKYTESRASSEDSAGAAG